MVPSKAAEHPEQQRLLTRIRAHLERRGETAPVREKAMFGVRAVMLGEEMLVSAHRDGSLLARVRPADHEELVGRPGAAQAEMGGGRRMGAGWISVQAEPLEDEAELAHWLDTALLRHRESTGG